MENFVIMYSNLRKVFNILGENRNVVATCSTFDGVYENIKRLKAQYGSINLTFTDSCIDELQRVKLYEKGGLKYGVC